MNKVLKKLEQFGIVPVVVLEDAKDAALLAKALCDGGLACAEVTFRTAAAEESIRIMSQKFPEMVVGAGTVLTVEQVDRAVKAGAQFIVSPGFNPVVVKYCIDHEIPITPGVVTPSEMEQAIAMGLEVVRKKIALDLGIHDPKGRSRKEHLDTNHPSPRDAVPCSIPVSTV